MIECMWEKVSFFPYTCKEQDFLIMARKGNFICITKLPTRMEFLEKTDELMKESALALCMISMDIRNFHFYNKWHGRAQGDALLGAISDYLNDFIKGTNMVAGYLGGDNFSIVMEQDKVMEDRVIKGLDELVSRYAGDDKAISAAFGGYKFNGEDISASDVYDYTVDALGRVRNKMGADIFWNIDASIKSREKEMRLIPNILKALVNKEFCFYVQPKCNIKNGKIIGGEALVRWVKPDGSLVPPGVFVPVMEEHGLITRLDSFIWEQVCLNMKKWIEEDLPVPPMSVNVSRIDINQLDVADEFIRLIRKYEIPASCIEIEITESAYMDDDYLLLNTIDKLHRHGFKVLIDDFGSGYSSLNMLKDTQADVLKLDMKLLSDAESNEKKSTSILESILEMSRQIRVPAIIEGLETPKQLKIMSSLGCEFAQGYYFYKPMPASEYEELLRDPAKVGSSDEGRVVLQKSHLQQFSDYFIKAANVDIITGHYEFIKKDEMHDKVNQPEAATIFEYIDRFAELGLVHPDDLFDYRILFNTNVLMSLIEKGHKNILKHFRYKVDGAYKWATFEVMVPPEYGDDNHIVLMTWKNADYSVSLVHEYEKLVTENFSKIAKVNLDTKKYEMLHVSKLEHVDSDFEEEGEFDDFANFVAIEKVAPEDAEKFKAFADIDKFKEHFKNSDEKINVRYNKITDGEKMPTVMEATKSASYTDTNPEILLYIRRGRMEHKED